MDTQALPAVVGVEVTLKFLSLRAFRGFGFWLGFRVVGGSRV